jgi:hypothetical protein
MLEKQINTDLMLGLDISGFLGLEIQHKMHLHLHNSSLEIPAVKHKIHFYHLFHRTHHFHSWTKLTTQSNLTGCCSTDTERSPSKHSL